jgi:3-methyladenine DNA glycosylase AlkD
VTQATAWVDATVRALAALAGTSDADGMRAYMKDVAPFLGVPTPDRRRALRSAWSGLPPLDEAGVSEAARALWARPEREYQYAACDLVGRHVRGLTGGFVADPVQGLLTTRPWWDTVDALGTSAITPLVARDPEQVGTMWHWLDSGNRWLVRAAIQHQRGLKERTDLDRLFAMCDRFAADREFFIAKAIGWALRDVTRWNAPAVQLFVDSHPALSAVARREAIRGLARSSRP